MKKFLVSLLLIGMLVLVPNSVVMAGGTEENETKLPEKTDHDKVTIHLFYASWCGHCHDFIDYFKTRYEEYADYFEIKTYLISTLSEDGKSAVSVLENTTIMQAVNSYFKTDNEGKELKNGIPLIIIGDSFVQSGFGSDGKEIINTALKEYKNKKYKDVVASIIKENKLDTSKVTDFKAAIDLVSTDDNVNTDTSTPAGKYDTAIIIGIFVVLIGGFAGLVLVGKK